MKELVSIAKSPELILRKLILPYLRVGGTKFLKNSKPLPGLKQSPREVLGLCIMSFMGKYFTQEDWTVSTDPHGRDGVVFCTSKDREGIGLPVEQVYIPPFQSGDLLPIAVSAIEKKDSKGVEYGRGYALIVFSDKSGSILIRELVPTARLSNFDSVWYISKVHRSKLDYYVALLKSKTDQLGEYIVSIDGSSGTGVVKKYADYLKQTEK